ncbi:MAG: GNAT family N-acetyltransferase [Terrisporobacter sp.]|uniref:GNAT family N-acetyltransferase n=1 Tax=Terrisporobacter sp. TaxID=1965305 RepID=UPI002FC73B7A
MEFRKSKKEDIKDIMGIISQAQEYFRNNNIDQWQNGYPNVDSITSDIESGESYVLTQNEQIIATAYLSFEKESDYDNIYEGHWLSNENCAVVHRIAVKSDIKGRGIAGEVFKHIESMCYEKSIYDIKIDTHRDNKSMQKFLEKQGFACCGVIYLKDNSERIGFEKLF